MASRLSKRKRQKVALKISSDEAALDKVHDSI